MLLLHDVPDEQKPALKRLLEYVLEEHGVIDPTEAEQWLTGTASKPFDGRIRCLLSFDDGFASNFEVAREILDSYGIKAIFFVCPQLIDRSKEGQPVLIARHIFDGTLDPDSLPTDMRLMSWKQCSCLLDRGHTIGSHTSTHVRLSRLANEERRREILGSAELLETRLGIRPTWFAYPFGDVDSIEPNSLEMVASRYQFGCSAVRGFNSETTKCLAICREHVDLTRPFEYQTMILGGGLQFLYWTKRWRLQKMLHALGSGRTGIPLLSENRRLRRESS